MKEVNEVKVGNAINSLVVWDRIVRDVIQKDPRNLNKYRIAAEAYNEAVDILEGELGVHVTEKYWIKK